MRFQILLLTVVVVFSGVTAADPPSVTVNFGDGGNCGKYVEDTGYLQVAGIKLLVLDGNHKITQIVPCKMQKQTSSKQVVGTCQGATKSWSANNVKVILSVRVAKADKFVTNDIEYRYNEKVMKMIEMKTYDPIGTQDKPFNAKSHLFVKEIKVYDGKSARSYSATDCFAAWPNFLIADHGLYTYVSNSKGLARVYFDPYVNQEYFLPE